MTSVPPFRDPAEFRRLPPEALPSLAEDIRQAILSACLCNGGHLGASLGVVELAIALHYCFHSPDEPILWDTGHQAYAHKLLTGRWTDFPSIRRTGGLSGFLSPDESPHDAFISGHASTALSLALGLAWARGRPDARDGRWTVAVMGDGGLTGGLAFEALNNVRPLDCGPLLLVVNDNQRSIGPNVGAVSAVLEEGRARDFFSAFGFEFAGPVDGHDLGSLVSVLRKIREGYSGRPVVLHVLTEKGKGYAPAEEQPSSFHGISPGLGRDGGTGLSFSDAFGEALCGLAAKDDRIVAITAAMPEGTGLSSFARMFPDRFFDVGIAEGHAVTFAASLATAGFKPVVAIYSAFLQRAVDSIIHDVAITRRGVIFVVDRAGLVTDGPTHHGAFDLSYFGMVPDIRVEAPAYVQDVASLLRGAVERGGPVAIRFPRGGIQSVGSESTDIQGVRVHQQAAAPRLLAIAAGAVTQRLREAAELVDPSRMTVTVLSAMTLKPIPEELLSWLARYPDADVLTVEENVLSGGFGETLLAAARTRGICFKREIAHAALPDRFLPHGSVSDLQDSAGLSVSAIAGRMTELLRDRR